MVETSDVGDALPYRRDMERVHACIVRDTLPDWRDVRKTMPGFGAGPGPYHGPRSSQRFVSPYLLHLTLFCAPFAGRDIFDLLNAMHLRVEIVLRVVEIVMRVEVVNFSIVHCHELVNCGAGIRRFPPGSCS